MKLAALAFFMAATPLAAETFNVQMYNRSENGPMIYEPSFLKIAPGDTVRFLSTQPGHNAASIDDMIPEGATPFKSKINDDFSVTLTEVGNYGIKCSPHYAMGMVMLIQVGDTAPVTLPEALPARARERFETIISQNAVE